MAGVEVESYEPAVPAIAGVVAAEVRTVDKHPNADKLTVCSVKAAPRPTAWSAARRTCAPA